MRRQGVDRLPRGERPLDVGDSPLLRFAADLRALRDKAGGHSYRQLGARAHYSATTLSDAAGGRKLPTLAVTLAYVRACEGDVAEWEDRWRQVAAEVLPGSGPAADEGHPPYAGLAAYGTEDAEWFFGRDHLLDDLEQRIAHRRFVAVFGASGAGKSSLLRAGLVPRMTGRVVVTSPSETADPDLDVDLLIVDQFEEVFTLWPDADRRAGYIDALLTSRCKVVIGVRADFYGHCAQHPALVEALTDGQLLLGPMGPEELRQVIMQPAVKASCTVETALVSRLIADATGQPGVLPLMSHALLETWRRRRGTTLTLAGYEAAGGIQHAIAQTAERTYTSLERHQRALARQVFLRLTALGDGTEDTKRRLPRVELDHDVDVDVVLDRLAHARLLTLDRDSVEIAHEALIRSWPRLRGWLAEDRDGLRTMRRLTEAAATWESLGRDPDALYRGSRLDTAVEWTQRDGVRTSAQERDFLAESLQARDRERLLAHRRTRRLRQLVALLAVLLVFAGTAVVLAITAQKEAAAGWKSSAAWYVANQSQSLRSSDPQLADQLAIAAHDLSPNDETRNGVLSARAASELNVAARAAFASAQALSPDLEPRQPHERAPSHPIGPADETVTSIAVNDAGQAFSTTLTDELAKVWDVTDLTPEVTHTFDFPVERIALDPARARTLVTVSNTFAITVWDWSDPAHPVEGAHLTGDHPRPVAGVVHSPDGQVVVTFDVMGAARLWDVTDPKRPNLVVELDIAGDLTAAALSHDHRTLALGTGKGEVRLYDVTDRSKPAELWSGKAHRGAIQALGFHRLGDALATVGAQDKVALWDVSDPRRPVERGRINGLTQGVYAVGFGDTATSVVTSKSNGTTRSWEFDFATAVREMCAGVTTHITREEWQQYVGALEYRRPCR
ncbi:XRE family transcriptional regulator [Saccharothrix sp. S26]|uniref:nSTAND1 domain-containing NTPase n=1 Tax=Saccharothrix sp. S26 TaxID=2907215 RepID=UPI001F2628F5|nr:XRE family transcriptional regulator [Saccharothrix sp. S26]MCE6996787.1 XRE family transcriptional regulator [Saccharothrix sp. S26]